MEKAKQLTTLGKTKNNTTHESSYIKIVLHKKLFKDKSPTVEDLFIYVRV